MKFGKTIYLDNTSFDQLIDIKDINKVKLIRERLIDLESEISNEPTGIIQIDSEYDKIVITGFSTKLTSEIIEKLNIDDEHK